MRIEIKPDQNFQDVASFIDEANNSRRKLVLEKENNRFFIKLEAV